MQLDSPRTTCQVFYKLFQSHPQLAWGRSYHTFSGYQLYGPDRLSRRLRHSDTVTRALEERWIQPYEADTDAQAVRPPTLTAAQKLFCDAVESSERDGKTFFGKEHICCLLRQEVILASMRQGEEGEVRPEEIANPTYLPDEVIKTLSPLLVIRHPLLVVDSAFRGLRKVTGMVPQEEDFEFQCTMKWTKILYDYFRHQLGITPTVIDSEDYIYRTSAVMEKLCAMYGLDPNGIQYTWDPVPEAYWPKGEVAREFVGHVMSSKGLERAETVG